MVRVAWITVGLAFRKCPKGESLVIYMPEGESEVIPERVGVPRIHTKEK
jgi:hypothetical protein